MKTDQHGVEDVSLSFFSPRQFLSRGKKCSNCLTFRNASLRLFLLGLILGFGLEVRAWAQLQISWTNNLLTVSGATLPGGRLEVWYLEAFCRSGAHDRDWARTTLPHKTALLTNEANRVLRFRTLVGTNVEVTHVVTAGLDEIDFHFTLVNHGPQDVDLQWFQPACIRVERFTGCSQSNYTAQSFIFTGRGLTTLAQTRRREDALYRGGQVYVMPGVDLGDANPRPLSGDRPTNGLIGCFSADGKQLLATASEVTHELFEGVYVCLHSDPHVGG